MLSVSFCVPVYNRAGQIRRCIESLIAQTADDDSYEIIVVDDHSDDGTAEVVQGLFDEHGFTNGRIHTLPQNSGSASTPRNVAAGLARGEYLFFVDSDDYVAPELADKISACAAEFGSDIIYPRLRRETVSGKVTSKTHAFARNGDIGHADVLRDNMINALSVLKAFRRAEWERLGIQFDPELRTGEDILVTTQFLFNTKKHSVIADRDYYIVVDHEAPRLTQTPTSRAATFRNYANILEIIYAGTLGDLSYKHRSAAMFINRIMRVGAGAGNAYLSPSVSLKSQGEWAGLFSELLSGHLPAEADAYLNPKFKEKVYFLRSGDLIGARFAVAFHENADVAGGIPQGEFVHLASMRADGFRQVAAGAKAGLDSALLRERRLNAQLKEMRESLSWRVTRPLRASARAAKRLTRMLPGATLKGSDRRPGGSRVISGLRLDEDGRPEAVFRARPGGDLVVYATVDPSGHRAARQRLPFRDDGARGLAVRLPVPSTVGISRVSLSVLAAGELAPVRAARLLRRVKSDELRVTCTPQGLLIERTAPAVPWQPDGQKGTAK